MMLWKIATTGTLALCTAGMCWAADEPTKPLTIGDPAPAIDIAHWLKGEKVGEFQPGKIYVLDFWATWCGPCRASVPHLSELQERYQDYDVSFIAVSDEKLQKVVPFLCKADKEGKLWNDKMQYTVAADPDRSAFLEYMLASGNEGIPTAFIIGRDGRIEWIGHPMGIDDALEAVVKDAWDRAEFKAKWEPKMAPERAKLRPYMKFEKARRSEDWPAALESIEELIAKYPKASSNKINKMLVYVRHLNQPEKGYAWGRQIMSEHWDDASTLNRLAWLIVDKDGLQTRDFELAMEAAMRANELTEGEDGGVLDTVARVFYETDDLKSAIVWQRKALDHAAGTSSEDSIRETLEEYQQEAENN